MLDGNTISIKVDIPAGVTGLSGLIDLQGCQAFAIKMPAAWVAAALTFQACEREGGTFYDLYDDAASPAEVSVPVAQQQVVALAKYSVYLAPLRYIKVRSGTAATPVNQTGNPTLYILAKAN